jgi:hypothetical protein
MLRVAETLTTIRRSSVVLKSTIGINQEWHGMVAAKRRIVSLARLLTEIIFCGILVK